MACNVPVISTDVGFVREALAGIDHAFISADEGALQDALESVLRTRPRMEARHRITAYDVEAMGAKLAEVYELALSE